MSHPPSHALDTTRLVGAAFALAAGALWVLRWLFTEPDSVAEVILHWGATVPFVAALCLVGAGLGSALALRAICAVALPLLVWSVIELVRPAGLWFDGAVGLALAFAGAAVVATQARVWLGREQVRRDAAHSVPVPAPRRGGHRVERSRGGARAAR
jgi:hypothetical protein